MSELLKELKYWRVEGGSVLRDYHDYDYWVNWDDIKDIVNKHDKQPQLNENQQIVIDLEMSDCSVEVAGWNYPEELDTENLRYLFSNVLENARSLEQEEENE